MLIYIAGPLSPTHTHTQDENVRAAVDAFVSLTREGVHAYCPHLCALIPPEHEVPYERWLEMDFEILTRCDAILMLDRWESSPGARREHALALEVGKRVIYDVEDLL